MIIAATVVISIYVDSHCLRRSLTDVFGTEDCVQYQHCEHSIVPTAITACVSCVWCPAAEGEASYQISGDGIVDYKD